MKRPTKTTSIALFSFLAIAAAATGCSDDAAQGGPAETPDARVADASTAIDSAAPDAAALRDVSAPVDATSPDGSRSDGSTDAAGPLDATSADASTSDASASDATVFGTVDAASADASTRPDATLVDAGGPAPAGATCANALTLVPPVTDSFTLDDTFGNEFTSGTGCFFKPGPDRVFAIDVPAGKRLYASVRGTGGSFDPSVAIVDGASSCADQTTTCLAANDVGLATSLNFAAVVNGGAQTKRFFVVVDGTAGGGSFDFRSVIGDPLPGDTCAGAQALDLGGSGTTTLVNQSVDLYANDYAAGAGCSGFAGGERVYRVSVPAQGVVALTVTPEATFDAALNVIEGAAGATPESACASAITCAAASNVGGAGTVERALLRNSEASAKTYFVTVDTAVSTSAPGSFSITAETLAATPGDLCSDAPRVTFTNDAAARTGESLATAFNDYGTGTTCLGTGGVDRAYALDIPAGKVLTVLATPTGSRADGGASTLDLALNLQLADTCAASTRSCIGAVNGTASGPERLVYANGTTGPLPVLLFVESVTSTLGSPATYDLAFTISDPPPGDTCSSVTTPTAPGSYAGQTLIDYRNDYGFGANCVSGGGPDRIYLVRVPDGQRLTATVTPDRLDGGLNWNPSINFMESATGCVSTGRVCVAGRDSASTGAPETLFWDNATGSTKDIYVAVETASSTPTTVGTTRGYTLDIALATPPPPLPGETCGNAETLTSGTPLTGQTILGYYSDYGSGSGCIAASGPDRVYKITVPAGERVEAVVTPSSADAGPSWDPSINFMTVAQCRATIRSCLTGVDALLTSRPEKLSWTNTASTPQDLYVVVETSSAIDPPLGVTRQFTITATTGPALEGDVCSDAQTPITANTSLTGQLLTNLGDDFATLSGTLTGSAACAFTNGPDRVHRVRIPAGATLIATATPDISWDASVSLVIGSAAACRATPIACAASADVGFDGDSETVTFKNTTGSALDAFVIVEAFSPDSFADLRYALSIAFN